MKVFLVGGGTGGPTVPLLAVAQALVNIQKRVEFFFVGTRKRQEQKFLGSVPIPMTYLRIPAGKWRRPFSLANLSDLFKILFGFFKALLLLRKYRPDVIFGAGSFVQVPVAWAGYLLRIPVVIHQQDFSPLLSTKLVAPFAGAITLGFSYTEKNIPQAWGLFLKFPKSKTVVTGNPVRQEILQGSAEEGRKLFGLSGDYPTLLVVGGGTGAKKLNEIVGQCLPELVKYVQVIHLTGGRTARGEQTFNHAHYHPYEFLGMEMKHALAVADLVISRGGMSTITELAALGKAAILVPLPSSGQEENVKFLASLGLVVPVAQEVLTPELVVKLVRKILWAPEIYQKLRSRIKRLMPPDASEQIARVILKIYNKAQAQHGK